MYILQELYLGTAGLICLLIGCIWKELRISYITALIFANAMILTMDNSTPKFFLLLLTLTILTYITGTTYDTIKDQNKISQTSLLILFSICGLLLLMSCEDFISLYLAIELYSLSVYILTSYGQSERNISAGLKYFMLGALQSGLLILGCALIYASTGEFQFEPLIRYNTIDILGSPIEFRLGVGLIIAAILFKIGSAPFHFWVADVYDGIPMNITSYLIVVPKVALIYVLVRLCITLNSLSLEPFIYIASILSLIIGSIVGLVQTRIRRLIAYSSIAHVGYMLLAILSFSSSSNIFGAIASLWLYVIIYSIMGLNFFGCLLSMKRNNRNNIPTSDADANSYPQWLDELRGLAHNNPYLALTFALTLLSMAGIPPLAGFVSKLSIYDLVIDSGSYGLAILGVLASVISAGYYLKLIKITYFSPIINENSVIKVSPLSATLLSIGTITLVAFIFSPSVIYIYNHFIIP